MSIRNYINIAEILYESKFTVDDFIHRYESAKQMVNRGATKGERQAGETALARLQKRAKQEMPKLSANDQSRLKKFLGITTSTGYTNSPPGAIAIKEPHEVIMRSGIFTLELRISGALAGYYIRVGDEDGKAMKIAGGSAVRQEAEDEFKAFVRIAIGLGLI